jgi:hypothetical protein
MGRTIVRARTTAVLRAHLVILQYLHQCFELDVFVLHSRQPRPQRVLEMVDCLVHACHRHKITRVGIEQVAVWARWHVPRRTELGAHVHDHSDRSEMTDCADKCERGAHLLHRGGGIILPKSIPIILCP